MITIYTTSSCSSCRKAKKWMEEYQIPYKETNLFVKHLSRDELLEILKRTENGMADIVSMRSKVMQDDSFDFDDFSVNEAIDFLIENPSAMRRPIIMDEKHFQIGYNDDEIRAFIPKELRNRECDTCTERELCPMHMVRCNGNEKSENNI